jgi:hypothetical protein
MRTNAKEYFKESSIEYCLEMKQSHMLVKLFHVPFP